MCEQDWALLGIEPTTELAAIKKAYALKLKVTRPDDDAEAYQALRGAYERVQQWLKWQQQEAASQAGEEPAAAPALAEPEAPPVTASEPPPVPEHVVQPQHLIDELSLRWRRSGESALLHEWSAAQRELDQQPLSRHVEFSAAFAQWVLGMPALPDDFLKALNSHFGWLDDFRTERQLGTPLAHALHEALDGRLRPAPLPEAVRELAAPLQRLHALRHAGAGKVKLLWLLFLLQPVFVRSQGALSTEWLLRLGLDQEAQRWLREASKRGLWLRTGAAAVVFGALALAVFGNAIMAAANLLAWLSVTATLMVAGHLAGGLLGLRLQPMASNRRWSLRLPDWCRDINGASLGLVWLLFSAWLFYLDGKVGSRPTGPMLALLPDWVIGYAAWGFAIAGIALARPQGGMRNCVMAGLAPLVGYLAMEAFSPWLPPMSCLLIGATWLLAGAALHEERLGPGVSALARWLVRPVLNSLILADRWTYTVALMPLTIATAYAALSAGEVRPSYLFAIWVLGILATGWLQTQADALGLRQLQAAKAADVP